jgi:uncharacterized membrane protein
MVMILTLTLYVVHGSRSKSVSATFAATVAAAAAVVTGNF